MDTTTDFEALVEAESRGLIAAVYTIVGDRPSQQPLARSSSVKLTRQRMPAATARDQPATVGG